MSFKVDMSAPDLDRQLYLLKYYPEFFKKHFRPVLFHLTSKGKQAVLAGVPRRTGKAAGAVRSKVTGAGERMEGHYGWYGENSPWYINIVEHGASAHKMNTFVPGLKVFIGTHPGFPKAGFMAAANESIEPVMNAELLRANEAVLNELVVK